MASAFDTLAWDDFRLIKAIADTASLTAAADRLAINHSTVFRRLKRIEETAGILLFERRQAKLVPTATGEEIVALAGRIGGDIDAVALRLAGREPAPSGELRVTTNDSLLIHLLTPVFATFRQACPQVRLDVVLGNSALNLSKRDADVAIRATDKPPETLVGRKLARIAWALYDRVADEQDARKSSDADLHERPWLALGDSMASMKVVRYAVANVRAERIGYRINSVLGLADAVEAGIGIAHLPCFIADSRAALVRLREPEPAFATDLWLLTHADLRHAARVRVFLDLVAAEIGKRRGLIEGQGPAERPAAGG